MAELTCLTQGTWPSHYILVDFMSRRSVMTYPSLCKVTSLSPMETEILSPHTWVQPSHLAWQVGCDWSAVLYLPSLGLKRLAASTHLPDCSLMETSTNMNPDCPSGRTGQVRFAHPSPTQSPQAGREVRKLRSDQIFDPGNRELTISWCFKSSEFQGCLVITSEDVQGTH